MKISNGTDIIEISRIKNAIIKKNEKFISKIYTEKEIEYCESKKTQKYQSYAARFAAKEAIYKALSEYIDYKYSWKDFEIINNEQGKPHVNLKYRIDNIQNIELSMSHCKEYAVASVVVIFK